MAAGLLGFASRFAGPALKGLKNILVPMTAAGKPAYGQLAARYAPDLLYSGLMLGALPEQATGTERFGTVAEDLGIGLAASVLGQVAGGTAAKNLRFAGKRLGPEAQQTAATLGDVLVNAPVQMYAPRPIYQGTLQRIYQEESPQLRESEKEALVDASMQELTAEQAQQELISLLLGAGAAGGRALT